MKQDKISKKTMIIIVIIILCSSTIVFYVLLNKANDYRDKNKTLSEMLSAFEEENNVLSSYFSNLESEKTELQEYLNQIENNINENNSEIIETRNNINQINTTLDTVISEIQLREDGTKYELHDPTYSEVKSFIKSDKTNHNEIIEGVYVCRHFSQDVNNNAEKKGIRCAYVKIQFTSSYEHACVGFQTSDKGMVYYEPMYDWEVNMEKGKNYFSECIICPPDYYFEPDSRYVIKNYILLW